MNAHHTTSVARSVGLALICLASAAQGLGAQPFSSSSPVTANGYVLVTNVVVVTNYVVTTNLVYNSNRVASTHINAALPDLSWVPPEDSFDWIQLNTGEWLKGRIKAMQDRQLEFFSEKLSDMTFDCKCVPPAPLTYCSWTAKGCQVPSR
jgi:hypothetical protein